MVDSIDSPYAIYRYPAILLNMFAVMIYFSLYIYLNTFPVINKVFLFFFFFCCFRWLNGIIVVGASSENQIRYEKKKKWSSKKWKNIIETEMFLCAGKCTNNNTNIINDKWIAFLFFVYSIMNTICYNFVQQNFFFQFNYIYQTMCGMFCV